MTNSKCRFKILGQITMFVLIFFNIYLLGQLLVLNLSKDQALRDPSMYSTIFRRPCFVFPGRYEEYNIVTNTTVKKVLQRLGYTKCTSYSEWDLLWQQNDPYYIKHIHKVIPLIRNLQPGQMVNHIIGMGSVFNKHSLTTSNTSMYSKYIPKTFSMPEQVEEFRQEVKKQSEEKRLWIQKNKNHRGNKVMEAAEDLDIYEEILIQEFIANQFLVHGHVIQFGVYVVVTSVEPLRVYIYVNEMSNRMADRKFHPFDFDDKRKYVTDGEHSVTGIQDLPEMSRYFKVGYSKTQALKDYMKSIGKNASKAYDQIYDAVRRVLLSRRDFLVHWIRTMPYFKSSNFFEISRWDFIADEDLNVYLLEANLSPNMPSSPSRPRPKHESILYSTLSAINGQRGAHLHDRYWIRDSDIHFTTEFCYSTSCRLCEHKACQLCAHCLNPDEMNMLKTSFSQHINRQGLRRAWPEPMIHEDVAVLDESFHDILPEIEQLNVAWFRAKCRKDIFWCA